MIKAWKNDKGAQHGFWNFIDSIKGDKVVWIIVFMLIMISILAVFSSTSLLAVGDKVDRLGIVREQIMTAGAGLGLIWILCRFKTTKFFRAISMFGFAASAVALLLLILEIDFGFIKAIKTNGVLRALEVMGFQIHVFEFVKVAMVMYLAWAIDIYKQDKKDLERGLKSDAFPIVKKLSEIEKLSFLKAQIWKKVIYIYIPMMITCVMIMPGSNSSAIFVGGILIGTLIVGGIPTKEIFGAAFACIVLFGMIVGIHKASNGKMFQRVGTLISRLDADYSPSRLDEVREGSAEFYKILDETKQPFGAKLAVHEGGILGKGSGNSTQKYLVPIMYGDYMFSFIVEEYGLWGAFIVIILYVSLLARGSMIARLCENEYSKVVVGGLSILITGQAFMHMFVNVDIGPMTGQTLPLISHGSSAFLMFSIAFGVILSISRMTREKIKEEEEAAEPIYERQKDELQATLQDIEQLERSE